MKARGERSRVKRLHEYARYDAEVLYGILDAMPVAHVSYILDGAPVVTPTLQWREGNRIYWHGSSASRMMKRARRMPVCVAVTIVDGLVLARSGFNHSINYRSAMLFGDATPIETAAEKSRHLETFMEQILPGRWPTLRPMSAKELKATAILSMEIDEASAKVTSGMPKDEEDDYAWPVWAGVIPIGLKTEEAQADPLMLPGITPPGYLSQYRVG